MERSEVLSLIKSGDVKIVRLWFTDILGRVKGFSIGPEELERAVDEGINFDGSSIGFRKVERSDMIALPDIETFKYLPYKKDEAIIRADLYDTDYKLYRADPRTILKKAVSKAKKEGFDSVKISPEMEFCSFNLDEPDQEGDKIEKTQDWSFGSNRHGWSKIH